MDIERGSGILLHITSLPGSHGIGDLGDGAYRFIDFLAGAAQRYWQFLPINPTSRAFGNSPYTSTSAFAGNSLFINPDKLVAAGLLTGDDLAARPDFSEYFVEFDKAVPYKSNLLQIAFAAFQKARAPGAVIDAFENFCQASEWLDEYALYMSLREEYRLQPWYDWPRPLATREKKALAECRRQLAARLEYHKFVQFCFFEQWQQFHDYARAKNIALIGDIPIYVGLDSADVWAHQDIFKLDDQTLQPTHVAGVPPDYFSKTGQRWGNPIYRWKTAAGADNQQLYDWWQKRFQHIFSAVDIVRIDHFRGFEASWEIPATEKTAVNGAWVTGPGEAFFRKIEEKIGQLPIIAEDLGLITPPVEKLRDDLAYPGMKVLQFAFDSDEHNYYLPHNYHNANCVVYTGTHDNDTTLGWFYSDQATAACRNRFKRYANLNSCGNEGAQLHWDFIRLALSSVAVLALTPLQDVLGFGSDCRMNTPNTGHGNWHWRCAARFLSRQIQDRLKDETIFYNRAPHKLGCRR